MSNHDDRTDPTTSWAATATQDATAPVPGADAGIPTPAPPEREWITGPSSPTLLAGLLTLVIAALGIVRLATDVDLEWSIAVPVTVIAVGFIAVVLGTVSFSQRSRSAPRGSTE